MTDPTNDPKDPKDPKEPGDSEGTGPSPAPERLSSGPDRPAVATATRRRSWWWLLPALTFVVGVVLGGLLIGLMRSGSQPTDAAISTETPIPSSGTPAPTGIGASSVATVVVLAECLKVSQDSQDLVDLTRQAAAAARDLDAAKLSDLVRQIDAAQTTLREHAAACRSVEASISAGMTPSETVLTPTATVKQS